MESYLIIIMEYCHARLPEAHTKWREVSIKELSQTVTSGSRDWSKYYSLEGSKFIRMTNLNRYGIHLLLDELKFVSLPDNGSEGERTSLKENDILVSITAELGKIGIIPKGFGKAYINQHTALVRPNNKIPAKFLAYNLSTGVSNKKLNRLNDSGAKSALNLGTLRNFKIFRPEGSDGIQEQQKIAQFLTTVDTKIEQLTKKQTLLEQYKKGISQKLFRPSNSLLPNGNSPCNPEIRFRPKGISSQAQGKDDDGQEYPDWVEKKLRDVAERVTKKNKENNKNVLTISAQQGLVIQEQYFTKSVSAKDVTGYYLLNRNDFAYNKSYSKGYPMGAIKRLTKYPKGVVSTLYICFRIKKDNVSFFEQFFNDGNINRELHKIAQEGARNHGLLNMSVIEFFNDIMLSIPSLPEQQKIANFLSSIDSKITQVSKQLDQTKQFKKALLQQMFV
ncbi:MAG: restriction endonuclease subunit S [Methylococcales bacterium]|nr:restriction endonuclease subunit S [Methylococcales bacterium]